MKVAYFSPLPPSPRGIADYSALLLPALERLIDVVVVRPGRTRPVADADVALYHIGNDPDAHGWILDALRRRSGVVVLHDFVLHHLIAGVTIGRNDGHAYLAAMEREAGAAGRMLGWGVLEGRVPPLWEVRPAEFPLVGEILDRATGLIVHSRYVEERVRERGYDGPVWHVPHPAWSATDVTPARIGGAPLVGCFGHINANKRVPQLLRAFAAVQRMRPDARLLLVGDEAPGYRLLEEPASGVIREPYVEEERLMSLISACDAVVLLRAPTMGETSGSAIRTLSLGKPLVVSDLGWFAELPDDVALKIPVGDGEEAALVAAFDRLGEPAVGAWTWNPRRRAAPCRARPGQGSPRRVGAVDRPPTGRSSVRSRGCAARSATSKGSVAREASPGHHQHASRRHLATSPKSLVPHNHAENRLAAQPASQESRLQIG
jgi:glycosyltransferase involved in cell wall biosynthesis